MAGMRKQDPNGAAPSAYSGGFRPNQDPFSLFGTGFSIETVPLIAQTDTMACWYASAQMLIHWRREHTVSCEIAHPDPSEVPELVRVFVSNDGLSIGEVTTLAKDLGLRQGPPKTPTPGAIEGRV